MARRSRHVAATGAAPSLVRRRTRQCGGAGGLPLSPPPAGSQAGQARQRLTQGKGLRRGVRGAEGENPDAQAATKGRTSSRLYACRQARDGFRFQPAELHSGSGLQAGADAHERSFDFRVAGAARNTESTRSESRRRRRAARRS